MRISETSWRKTRDFVRTASLCWPWGAAQRALDESVAYATTATHGGQAGVLAVQIHGGSGCMQGVPLERIYRDVRPLRLYEGTSEIQRLIIGGCLIREAQRRL
jgi:acyl-CoA dehydrogenase